MKNLSEEEFKKLENPSIDLEKEKEDFNESLKEAYLNIIDILKEYIDLKEEYYSIVSLWIIGTYFHNEFPSYPFLFFNAQKGSGKSRIMNLITTLSKDGTVMNSMTEAVLFRTKGTLAIDEFEVYRPIVLANIWGMENVLGDRCLTLILEKSNKKKIVNLMEIFDQEDIVISTKKLLNQCSLCRCSFYGEVYKDWNFFVKNNYTNYINNTNNTNNTNNILPFYAFKSINLMDLNGRELELSFPLCLISAEISKEVLKETTLTLKSIFHEKRTEELVEDRDISLIDFVAQNTSNYFQTVNDITSEFRRFLDTNDEWINSKWMGRALKRLALVKQKRRVQRGNEVILDIKKAQEKIKMFKI